MKEKFLVSAKVVDFMNGGRIFFQLKNWSILFKRIVYIGGFIILCAMDQMVGSATGYIQYGYRNYSGIIIGIFILTTYPIRDFLKVSYLVWIILFLFFKGNISVYLQSIIYNGAEVETNLWGIGLYGIILIRMFYQYVIEKKTPKINWIFFGVGMLMYIGMAVIRNDYSWTSAVLGTYLCFYLTEFKEKDLNNFFSGMLEGIIIGFLIIQVQAWQYRPYDTVRYKGMYSHANMNAMMYLWAYCATLGKWYLMKLKRCCVLLRVPFIGLSGLIIATMFYTGGRAAFITAIALTAIFLFFQVISRKRWGIVELLVDGGLLVFSIAICVMPAYWLIRYVPMQVNEPLYFETDYGKNGEGLAEKIQKDDPIDSEKYVEFDEATAEMFERYLWFLDDEMQVKVELWIRELPEKLKISLQAEASELKKEIVESVPGDSSENPLTLREDREGTYDVRLDIFDYFLRKLPMIGEKNNTQGVWISKWTFATHCHNLFIQMAYDFGLIIGFWFIGIVILIYVCVLIGLIRRRGSGSWYFRLFIVTMFTTMYVLFGMFENVWTYGQLAFTMFFICLYMVYHQDIFYRNKPKKVKVKANVAEKIEAQDTDLELEIIDLSGGAEDSEKASEETDTECEFEEV